MSLPPRVWEIPQGLRVTADGRWRVGDHQVLHPPTLRYLKAHLVFEEGSAFVVDGGRRMPVDVRGPAFEAVSLVVDDARGVARVVLDDGSEEPVREDALRMDEESGRFECAVRGGRARALLSRAAHQTLLQHVAEERGRFVLRAGDRVIPVRT
ncbi:MAG TPA: hypothetical protein VFM29_07085 [Vicinamibacteria bacterium]|nr:hypothetical protein [Vicinamibacteria bacterium]